MGSRIGRRSVGLRAIVVGGGIGGLTAAVALLRAGLEVRVFERAEELRAVGAGISIWANAVRALERVGLGDAVGGLGAEIGVEVRSWRGDLLTAMPASEMRRLGGANLALHRADLQTALLSALPEGTIRTGSRFVRFENGAGQVVAHFADGREERGDLLVGADGLFSTVREQLHGDGRPRYAGYTAWRGVAVPGRELVPEGGDLGLMGRGSEFGLANIGRGRFYWYLTKNAPEGEGDDPAGRKGEVLERLRGWYGPAPEAVEVTDEEAILRSDIYDREPLGEVWGRGRVTLLGDAAHPMTPNLGQGACQAIEDAVVLAHSLAERPAEDALRHYEGRRAGRTAMIQHRSRLAGRWFFQLENPIVCRLRDAAFKYILSRAQLRQLEPIVGYEV
jgi:2-polyprenyl-6-methoxyphenol hydroxylase-like FAD-dependent oxidoreductase